MNVEDCIHFRIINFLSTMPIKNMDLTAFTRQLYEYFELVKKLELYADKSLKAYKK